MVTSREILSRIEIESNEIERTMLQMRAEVVDSLRYVNTSQLKSFESLERTWSNVRYTGAPTPKSEQIKALQNQLKRLPYNRNSARYHSIDQKLKRLEEVVTGSNKSLIVSVMCALLAMFRLYLQEEKRKCRGSSIAWIEWNRRATQAGVPLDLKNYPHEDDRYLSEITREIFQVLPFRISIPCEEKKTVYYHYIDFFDFLGYYSGDAVEPDIILSDSKYFIELLKKVERKLTENFGKWQTMKTREIWSLKDFELPNREYREKFEKILQRQLLENQSATSSRRFSP